jgi:hypothetical protein
LSTSPSFEDVNRFSLSHLLIPLVGFLAILYPLTSFKWPTPEPSTSAASLTPQPAKSKATRTKYDVETLVADYWGAEPTGLDVQFLIATVPDPRDSSLAYLFDRHVASLELATETAEYAVDRFELPWSLQETAPGQGQEGLGESESDELSVHAQKPGIILFRNTHSRSKLLVVFLVGETPTAGIHKSALKDAFAQATQWCRRHPRANADCSRFRLLGPTFSGSKDSLVNAVSEWPDRPAQLHLEIVSGSATAIEPEDLKTELAEHDIESSFQSALMRDSITLDEVFKFLNEKKVKDTDVVFLTEGSTLYGKEIRFRRRKVLRVTYPLHISQLRTVSEKSRREALEAASETPRTRPKNLPLSLDGGENGKDVIPNFSPFETFSTELVLSSLLSSISRENKPYIGIFATDVRDLIFLAHEIRKQFPNSVLFTFGADLLYLHTDVNPDLQGMLLFSTYPLFSMNQVWTHPDIDHGSLTTSTSWLNGHEWRWQFPSDTSQGVYNATLGLIYAGDGMLETDLPFQEKGPVCVQDTSARTKLPCPSLWLSAVGKTDIWPIRFLTDTGNPDIAVIGKNNIYSKSLVFVFLPLAIGFVFTAIALFANSFPESWPGSETCRKIVRFTDKRWLAFCRGAVFPERTFARQPYLFYLSLSLATLGLVGVSVLYRFLRIWQQYWLWAGQFTLFVAATILAFIAMLFWGFQIARTSAVDLQLSREPSAQPSSRRFWTKPFRLLLALLPMLLSILVFSLAANEAASLYRSRLTEQLFFHLRTINLSSGLSPLVPLFFVGSGALLWQLCSLRRLRMLEGLIGNDGPTRPQLVYLGEESKDTLKLLEADIIKSLSCHWLELPASFTTIVLIGPPCFYLFVWGLIPSLELRPFYIFFGLSFFLVYMALAFTFLRFLAVWTKWRRLLRYLASDPIGDVYAELADKNHQMPRMDLSSPFTPYAVLRFSWDLAASCPQSLTGDDSDIPETLNASSKADASGNWKQAIELRHQALRRLCEVASTIGDRIKARPNLASDSMQNAKSFWAGQSVVLFHHIFSHMENLSLFVVAGLLLMLLAITYYPFQPKETLLFFNWLIFAVTIGFSLAAFVQMSRNKVLSLLSGTSPGHITWNRDFILRVVIYAVIPFLALIGAQFPQGVGGLISWVTSFQKG